MPRTAARGRPRDSERPAEDHYDRLKWHEQYICYQYWNWKATRGAEGWNPSDAGSVYHQRSSSYLLTLGSDSWFRHLGQKMVTLAEKFEAERKIPSLPYGEKIVPRNQQEGKQENNEKKQKVLTRTTTAPAPPLPPIMPTLLPRTPSTPTTNAVSVEAYVPSATISTEFPPLTLPMCFGSFKKFDYTSRRKKREYVCVRILTHSAVELHDIEYDWVTPSVLKIITIYWPEWFTFAEQMAMFVVDEEDGTPDYPPEHPLTESFAENNALLMGEDNRIMNEGYITFEKDMSEEGFVIERLNIDIKSKNIIVRGIQIFAR
jgi:hypothetical protein